jgi:hypothetical protein
MLHAEQFEGAARFLDMDDLCDPGDAQDRAQNADRVGLAAQH